MNRHSRITRWTLVVALAAWGAAAVADEEMPGAAPGSAPSSALRSIAPVMFGERVVTGYPLLRGRFNSGDVRLGHIERTRSHFDLALHLDLAVLRRWPEIFDDDRVAYEYARRFLVEETLSQFVVGCAYGSCDRRNPYDGWGGANEFEREATWRAFVEQYRPALIDRAADFPIQLVQVLQVTVQPYDSARGAFPLRGLPAASIFASVPPARALSIDVDWSFPKNVTIDRSDAAAFLERLEAPERTAFLGLHVSLVTPDWDQRLDRPKLELDLERAALYADPDLRTEIHEFSLWGM